MNKCIILCMTCNDSHFIREMNVIKESWGKDILDGNYQNLDIWFYTTGNKNYIDIDNHIIYVIADDSLYGTWEKTYKAIQILDNYIDYDFIFRTNTSNVINIKLLNNLINYLNPYLHELWSVDFIYDRTKYKDNNVISPIGAAILCSRHIFNLIINDYSNNIEYYKNKYDYNEVKIDDVAIGTIINEINTNTTTNIIYRHFKGAFYKSFPVEKKYSSYEYDLGNTHLDINIFKNVLNVRIKTIKLDGNFSLIDSLNDCIKICEISNLYKSNDITKEELDNISKMIIDNSYSYEIRIVEN